MNQPLVVCQQQPNGDGKTLKSAFPKNGKRGEKFSAGSLFWVNYITASAIGRICIGGSTLFITINPLCLR